MNEDDFAAAVRARMARFADGQIAAAPDPGARAVLLRPRAETVEGCVAENMVDHRARRLAAMEARRQRGRRH